MMKKLYIIGIVTIILTACGGSTGGGIFSSGSIDMKEAKATKTVSIVNEDNAPQCQVNLQVKYMKGDDDVAKNINNAIT
jgi:flagellar basal body-associated protein FliL